MSQSSAEYFAKVTIEKMNPIVEALLGLTCDEIGLTQEFVQEMVEEVYLGLFTEEEMEEMVKFEKRFKKRNALAGELIETRVNELMEKNSEQILAILEAKNA